MEKPRKKRAQKLNEMSETTRAPAKAETKTSDSTDRRKKKDDPCRGPRRGPLPHRVVAAQRLPGCLAAWLPGCLAGCLPGSLDKPKILLCAAAAVAAVVAAVAGIYGNPKENLHSKPLPPTRKSEKNLQFNVVCCCWLVVVVGCRQHTQRPPAGAIIQDL